MKYLNFFQKRSLTLLQGYKGIWTDKKHPEEAWNEGGGVGTSLRAKDQVFLGTLVNQGQKVSGEEEWIRRHHSLPSHIGAAGEDLQNANSVACSDSSKNKAFLSDTWQKENLSWLRSQLDIFTTCVYTLS